MRDKNYVLTKLSNSVNICDTTLRDGEQTAGIVFANLEKFRIAKMLDEVGVQQIEAGIPAMGGDEKKAIRRIANMGLDASILGWNRASVEDLQHSLDCGVDSVALSMSSSDIHIEHKLHKSRQWVLDAVEEAVSYAADHGLYISCNAEDASRADLDFLVEFSKVAKDAGADRIRYCDTIGLDDPFSAYERVKTIIDKVDVDVEMHTHNDFGMATANSVAGIKAGARFVSTTVMGIGERTGNTPLEEIVMASKHILDLDTGIDTRKFLELVQFVARASNREIPAWKPIVGTNCFAHEAGIHADGVIKMMSNYEPFSPEEVGLCRRIVIGKHSGRNTLIAALEDRGIELKDDEAISLLERVRAASVSLKRCLSEDELYYLYQDLVDDQPGPADL